MSDRCIEPRDGRELELAYYAGGDLAPEADARVEEHLAACPACRSLVQGLRESQAGLAALAAEPLDPEALARVRHAVRRRIEAEVRRPTRAPVWVLPLAAGLLLALVGAALWLRVIAPRVPDRPSEAPERVATAPPPEPSTPPAVPAPEAPAGAPGGEPEGGRAPAPERAVHRAAIAPRPEREPAVHPPTERMVIQVVSDDPDIVFYWLVEPEETEDATVSS